MRQTEDDSVVRDLMKGKGVVGDEPTRDNRGHPWVHRERLNVGRRCSIDNPEDPSVSIGDLRTQINRCRNDLGPSLSKRQNYTPTCSWFETKHERSCKREFDKLKCELKGELQGELTLATLSCQEKLNSTTCEENTTPATSPWHVVFVLDKCYNFYFVFNFH